MRTTPGIYRHALISLPALVVATSCVPHDTSRALALWQAQASREADPQKLLQRLALSVPDDIGRADRANEVLDAARSVSPILAAPPFAAVSRSDEDANRAVDCLTAAVYYEARSQSADGQRAVAQVVLNRVRDRAFPKSVCGVVYQGSARSTGCQFSFTCDGSMNRSRERGAWDRARIVAAAALAGAVYAPIGAATFYHADSVSPWWAPSLARVASVGAHIFYSWRGGLERALAFRQSYAGIEPVAGSVRSAAASTPASDAIVIHYPGDAIAGVAIHRNMASSITPTALVSGVRIHVGSHPSPAMPTSDDVDGPVQVSDQI